MLSLAALVASDDTQAALVIERTRGDPLRPQLEQAILMQDEATDRLAELEALLVERTTERDGLLEELAEAETRFSAAESDLVRWSEGGRAGERRLDELKRQIETIRNGLTGPLAELALARAQDAAELTVFRLEAVVDSLISQLTDAEREAGEIESSLETGAGRSRQTRMLKGELGDRIGILRENIGVVDEELAALDVDLSNWRGVRAERLREVEKINGIIEALIAERGLTMPPPPHLLSERVEVRMRREWPHADDLPQVVALAPASSVMPVSGRLVAQFGDRAEAPLDKGVLFEAEGGSRIVAPRSGKIVFAGPFQRYGQLLIIDHGDGYHTLLAGFDWLGVKEGNEVETGQLVGSLAGDKQDNSRLYLELRERGKPANPLPWLAAEEDKVRG